MIYFDSAATTLQKPESVPAAVAEAIRTVTTPGRGDHAAARGAAELLLQCRTLAAEMFDVSAPDNVVLTGNATQGLNIAIKSLVEPGDTVVISGYEHNAVTRPLHAIGGVKVRVVNGRLFDREQMAEGFRRAVDGGVKAVICCHVSNVFGYALPVEEIAGICAERGVPLVVDAAQSAGILPVQVEKWGAAYVAMPGHKGLYGPQGTGLLLCGRGQRPRCILEGGTGSLSRQQDMPEELPDRLARRGCWRVCALSSAWARRGSPGMRPGSWNSWGMAWSGRAATGCSGAARAPCCRWCRWTARRRPWPTSWPPGAWLSGRDCTARPWPTGLPGQRRPGPCVFPPPPSIPSGRWSGYWR